VSAYCRVSRLLTIAWNASIAASYAAGVRSTIRVRG
jgi:hypothetical protein